MNRLLLPTAAMALASTMLAGCEVLDTPANANYSTSGSWNTPVTFTTADVRMVTQRPNPVTGKPVICSEPVPDVATAQAEQAALNASGGNGAVTASLGGSLAAAQTVAELSGRTAAQVALRDTMFRACEAYGNGALGESVYALVVSRYPELMATMFGAQDIASAGSSAALVQAIATLSASPDKSGSTTPDSNSTPKPSGEKSKTTMAAAPRLQLASFQPDSLFAPVLLATGKSNAGAGSGSGGTPKSGTSGTKASSGSGASSSGEDAATAIDTIVNHFLELGIVGPLFVACINESDQTRLHVGVGSDDNPWLATLCDGIQTPDELMELIQREHEAAAPATTSKARTGSRMSHTAATSPTRQHTT